MRFPFAGLRARLIFLVLLAVIPAFGLVVYTFADREGYSVYVSVGIPAAVAYAEAHQALARNLASLVMIAVLALVATWIGGGVFVLRPVKALMQAMKRLAAGDLSARTGLPGEVGGLGQLAHSFDTMAEALDPGEAERRRAQEALRESQQLLERTFASLHDAVFIIDAATTEILDCNPAASDMFGYTREEMVGRTTAFLHVDEATLEEFRAHLYPAVEEKGFLFLPEFRMKRKDGTVFPTEHNVIPLEDERGKRIGWVSVVRDITERKQAEEEIRQRTAQLKALHQVSLELTTQLDLDTLLRSIVSRAIELLDASSGGLYLHRPERDVLEWAMAVGPHLAPIGTILRRGEGLSGRVWETGEPLIVDDYQHWEGRAVVYEGYPWTAIVGVPVRWGEEFLGVLNVLTDPPRTFSPSDAELLSLFAAQAAIAIQNARLFQAEAHRRREAETLQAAALALSATLDLQQVFEAILRELREVVPYDSASVQQLKGDRLEIIGGHGFPNLEELLGVSFDLTAPDNPNREVVRTRAPLILEDAPTVYKEFGREPHAQAGIRSWLGVPLLFGDRLIGMITLDKREPGFYTEDHARLALAFAAQAAIAIENARLYEETRRRAERLAVVNHIARAASAILHLDDLMETVYREVTTVFEADAFFIALYDEGTKELDYRLRVDEGIREPRERRPLGTGLTSLVVSEKKPLLIRDFEKEKDHLPEAGLWGTMKVPASWLGVPMLIGQRVVGVICVQAYRPHAYGEQEQLLLSTIADQVAVAVENARLFEEERRRVTQLALINEVGEKATSVLDLDRLMQAVTHSVRESFNYYNVGLLLLDHERRELVLRAIAGGFEHAFLGGYRQSLDEGIVGLVARTGRSWLTNDVSKDPYYIKGVGEVLTQSELAVPIKLGDKVIGVLDVQSIFLNAFDQADVVAMEAVADRLAIAMENARLYEETQRHSERLAQLVEERTAELKRANEQLAWEIAERRQAQKVLAQLNKDLREYARQLEAANKELETFSYSVSHDLRAPLRAIDGFTRILLEDYAAQLPPEAQRYLRLVCDSTQHMSQLIDDLLAFSRLGRLPLNKQPVAPTDIVHLALEDLRSEREGRQVEIRIGDLPACQADPLLLRQVFVNLLDNALKFTRGREVAVIEVGCREEEGEPVYFVQDNGVGFDMQYADKLFGVFQRLHRAEEYEGTGVGLAVVQHIIHRHGGRVWAEAEVDKGATFYFTLGGGTPNDRGHRGDPAGRRQS